MLHIAAALALVERRAEGSASSPGPWAIGGIVVAVIAVAVIGRIVTHSMDRTRIAGYAAAQGWTLTDCRWTLFGPGWLGGNRTRSYSITYVDRDGRTHQAFARTSVLSGVFLTEDRLAGAGDP